MIAAAAAALRPHRLEILGMALAALLCILLATGLAIRLASFGLPAECFADIARPALCDDRARDVRNYVDTASHWALPTFVSIALLPAITGLFLGAAVVGKELDQRTTVFAWSLAPSRRHWLLVRVVPIAIAAVGASLIVGSLGDIVQGFVAPGYDATRSFEGMGMRGAVLGGAALSAFGLSLLVGAVVGRLLPIVFIAGALVVSTQLGVAALNDVMLRSETVFVEYDLGPVSGRVIDSRILTPEGEIITFEDAYERYGDLTDQAGPGSLLRMLLLVNPGEIYPIAVARAAVIHGALGLAAIVLAFVVVDRRRP